MGMDEVRTPISTRSSSPAWMRKGLSSKPAGDAEPANRSAFSKIVSSLAECCAGIGRPSTLLDHTTRGMMPP